MCLALTFSKRKEKKTSQLVKKCPAFIQTGVENCSRRHQILLNTRGSRIE